MAGARSSSPMTSGGDAQDVLARLADEDALLAQHRDGVGGLIRAGDAPGRR